MKDNQIIEQVLEKIQKFGAWIKHKFINIFGKIKTFDEKERRNRHRYSHIPFRLNFLFFIIFALFVALIAQLGYLQIVNGENIDKQIKSSSVVKVTGSTPRGVIYDAKGTPLVSNQSSPAITFTRGNKMEGEDLYKIANTLNTIIDVPADELTERDKKDYWLANPDNIEEARKRLSTTEKYLDPSEEYKKLIGKVSDEEIQFDESQMKAATIFKRMNEAAALNTVYVKNQDVTQEELAVVSERSKDLPGISTGMDWTRQYNSEDGSLRSILGTVSTSKQGIPAESEKEYLAKGYARNDRVGTSYLEKQYEDVLQGTKSQIEVALDHEGNISKQKEVFEGEKGSNLIMTIDSDFQKTVEDILKRHYEGLLGSGVARYSPGAYAVVLNPKNGEVLAMTGFSHEIGSSEIQENALGTITSSFEPGSVVKGGTITAGYQAGVITGNDTLIDEPIKLSGTALKGSIFNKTSPGSQIPMDTITALEWSSNSYMMKIVLKMLGVEYSYNMALPEYAASKEMFDKLRSGLAAYGMGTQTGIDLPNESGGLVNNNFGDPSMAPQPGSLLDLSFGQYDTYTPMQLAQYAATVANGGKRIAPHVVKGIYNNDESGGLGSLKKAITPKILNTVDITPEQMNIIQTGFYQAVHGNSGWTTATSLQGAKLDPSAKTGTAETMVNVNGNIETTINSNIVSYAPANDPEIAISVMLPNLSEDHDDTAKNITKDIIDAYADYANK